LRRSQRDEITLAIFAFLCVDPLPGARDGDWTDVGVKRAHRAVPIHELNMPDVSSGRPTDPIGLRC
jgi:hypothetical protein